MSRLLLASVHVNNLQSRIRFAIRRMLYQVMRLQPHVYQRGTGSSGGNIFPKLLRKLAPGSERQTYPFLDSVPRCLILYLPHLGYWVSNCTVSESYNLPVCITGAQMTGNYEMEMLNWKELELLNWKENSNWKENMNSLRKCNQRLLQLQHLLICRSHFLSLGDSTPHSPALLRFAVHVCMWSIVAIRAFHDPGRCNWLAIDGFPPCQNPPLQDTVLSNLVNALSTTDGADIPWRCDMGTLTEKQQEQLIDGMHGVVKHLA